MKVFVTLFLGFDGVVASASVHRRREAALRSVVDELYDPDEVHCHDSDVWANAIRDGAAVEDLEAALDAFNNVQTGGKYVEVQEVELQ